MPHRDTSVAIKQAITQTYFQWGTITLHCSNQSGVVILANYFFKVYMLQVKVNRHNYNSYIKLSISHD